MPFQINNNAVAVEAPDPIPKLINTEDPDPIPQFINAPK
jgi:hypothetical protein